MLESSDMHVRRVLSVMAAIGLGAVACGGVSGADLPAGVDGGAQPDAPFLGTNTEGACDANQPGCRCSAPGATAACWTGPSSSRGTGQCKDGTTTCQAGGEFSSWGPCVGEVLACGSSAGATTDGGASATTDGGVAAQDAGSPSGDGGLCVSKRCSATSCTCTPGAVIWCDEDCTANIFCVKTAKQECLPNGTWGACHETTEQYPKGACMHVKGGCSENGGLGLYQGDCSGLVTCQ